MATKSQGDQIRDPIAGAAGNVKDFFVDDVSSGLQTAGQSIAGVFGFDVGGDNKPQATPEDIVALQQAQNTTFNDPRMTQELQTGPRAFRDARTTNQLDPSFYGDGPASLGSAGLRTPEQEFNYINPDDPRFMPPQIGDDNQSTGGTPTDPFTNRLTDLQQQRKDTYEKLFTDQESFAQDKFDSITSYLNELGVNQQEQYQLDMNNMSMQYDQMQTSRNERFEEAYARGGDRSSLAIDTLSSLGITPNMDTFDSATGATRDMLFSQQQSGADMLNTMRFISNQMLDFGASSASRSISAGLQQSEMNLAEEMANIQMARDSQAISDLDASIAQERATQQANAALARAAAQEEKTNQYAVIIGAMAGLDRDQSIAAKNTGQMNRFLDIAFASDPEMIQYGMLPNKGDKVTMDELKMFEISQGLEGALQGSFPMNIELDNGNIMTANSPNEVQTIMNINSQGGGPTILDPVGQQINNGSYLGVTDFG